MKVQNEKIVADVRGLLDFAASYVSEMADDIKIRRRLRMMDAQNYFNRFLETVKNEGEELLIIANEEFPQFFDSKGR